MPTPTVASSRPSAAETSPISSELPETPATVVSAKSISMKNSGGPMCSASTASGAAKKISDRFEMKSPVTEE